MNVTEDFINSGSVFPLQVFSDVFVVIENTRAVLFLSSRLDDRSGRCCTVLLQTSPFRGLSCRRV